MPDPAAVTYLRPALLTAALAAALSLVVAAGLVLLGGGTPESGAELARTSVRTWLVSLGSGLDAGPVSLSLVPIGAVLVCIGLVTISAAWILAEMPEDPIAYAATTAGAFGVVAGIASAGSNAGDVQTSFVRAAVGAFVVGGIGAALGATARHGSAGRWWFTSSSDVRIAVRGSVPGILAVLGSAAVVVLVLLVRHIDRAGDLWALLDPGLGGGIALAVASLLAIPTLVLWTASVLIGPGFALGTDTSVDLTGAQLGAVPGFPVLAALPGPGEFASWVFVLGLLPLLAGMFAGWRLDPEERQGVAGHVALGAAAGGIAGFVLGVMIGISGGAIGPGRMADAGPPVFTPLLVAVPVMAMGGALGAALSHYRGRRAAQPSDTSSPGRPRLWRRQQSASTD